MQQPIVKLSRITRSFTKGGGVLGGSPQRIDVLRNINLSIYPGEVTCLVGESGCGKTTTGKIIAGLLPPTTGQVLYEGHDLGRLNKAAFTKYRKAVQLIHQDPYAALNPTHTVYSILSAPMFRHRLVRTKQDAVNRVADLLETVDLTPVQDFVSKYPHQLSGGQRQRVVVARSLILKPRLIVADEPVSMLDVSIRLSVIGLLRRLQEQMQVAFLFITHDLAMAKYFGVKGNIAVLYWDLVEMPLGIYYWKTDDWMKLMAVDWELLPEGNPDTFRVHLRQG
ncbi:MAG: ABC transporter ATP-binding protein, partial [Firmicutes bacterium]|nr:ABC transporter ATP-binding protein [Bacillota bacterium]